jgi:hypothetical protein
MWPDSSQEYSTNIKAKDIQRLSGGTTYDFYSWIEKHLKWSPNNYVLSSNRLK